MVRFWSLDHYRAEPMLWADTDWTKFVFAAEGTLLLETNQQHHVLPPNRALLLAANQPHTARTAGRACIRTLYFHPCLALPPETRVIDVRPLFRELVSEACRIGPLRRGHTLHEACLTLLLAEVQRAPMMATSIRMPTSLWAKDWAQAYLLDPASSPAAPCSKRTLERTIHRETHVTLGQWCQQARAIVGLRALSEGATVMEAAMTAGYETTSGFIQAFRRQFGVTPGRILHGAGN